MMSRVGKTEGAGALHRGILEARLEKRAILPNFNVDIRDPKFLIGVRLTESNLRFRNFGFEMGFCPISQFPPAGYSSMLLPSARRGMRCPEPFALHSPRCRRSWNIDPSLVPVLLNQVILDSYDIEVVPLVFTVGVAGVFCRALPHHE